MPVSLRVGPPAGILGGLWFCLLVASFSASLVASPAVSAEGGDGLRIVVNLPSRTLSCYFGADLVRRYPVAVGDPLTRTPLGRYRIAVKVLNPTWYPKKRTPVPPGPENPVGTRWLGLSAPDLGLHGTNNPDSIGRAVSGGCIRMRNADVEELFGLVEVGTPVDFTYARVEVVELPPGEGPGDAGGAGEQDGAEMALVYRYGLVIHPDVYRQGAITPGEVRERLLQAGLTAELDATRLARQAREARGTLEPLPVVPRVVVEGRPARGTRWLDDRLWLPAGEAAELLGTPLYSFGAESRELGDGTWVAAADLAQRWGYRLRMVPAAATLYLSTPLVFWEGAPAGRAWSGPEGVLVPLLSLARASGREVAVDPCLGLATGAEGARTAPVSVRGEEAYLDPVSAAGLLSLDVSVTPEGVWFTERAPVVEPDQPA